MSYSGSANVIRGSLGKPSSGSGEGGGAEAPPQVHDRRISVYLPDIWGSEPAPAASQVIADFYDRALLAALTGAIAGTLPLVKDFAMDEPCGTARAYARDLTEARFGVRLILPGEGEKQ